MVVDRRASPGRPSGVGIRMLLLVAALAGLFAMHGLSDHGVGGVGGSVMPVHGHEAVHDPMHLSAVLASAPGGEAHLPGVMGACLAVVGLGLVLAALRRLPVRVRSSLARRAGGSRAVTARARAPDPPDLRHLCVRRC